MKSTAHKTPTHARGQRRLLLIGALGALAAPLWAATPSGPLVEVWKSPTCGCCADWVLHLEANGFRTKVYDEGNSAMRARMGVEARYGSCHTGVVAGYAIEGHVPAREIKRLLKERPAAIGLAAPGMPIGSPGMDGPAYAGRKDPYEVLLLLKNGRSSVYQAYA
ncbi:MAG: DUF411 domain-containing protein [Burkholderiaceae bacterium]